MDRFDSVRKPSVAGAFYPGNPRDLKGQITDMLARAEKAQPATIIRSRIFGLIVPHAGYIYSGQIAAYGYNLVKHRDIDIAIVISPSHMELFPFASVFSGDAYETPLGILPIDKDLAEEIATQNPLVKRSEKGHIQNHLPHREHSLEVQLPFLQSVFNGLKIVPIVMGDQNWDICEALGATLGPILRRPEVLAVASSDLSHFHPYEEAKRLDNTFCHHLEDMDPEKLFNAVHRNECEACGAGPVISTMIAARRAGADTCRILQAANSGDVTGDRRGVVGYASAALFKKENASNQEKADKVKSHFEVSDEERKYLLAIARNTILEQLKLPYRKLEPLASPILESKYGAFVTLKINNRLRGCIGYIEAVKPLRDTIIEMAKAAAFQDPRFPSLEKDEVSSTTIEISVLSHLRLIGDIEEIKVGRHGLVVEKGLHRGLLLPQVAVEYNWNREQFLDHTCEKAGLPTGAWQDPDTKIFVFSAEVFGEDAPPKQ